MKNKIRQLLMISILMLVSVITCFAQPVPPAPGPGSTPIGAPVLGCSAPIGDGYLILLVFVLFYGVYQGFQLRKEKLA